MYVITNRKLQPSRPGFRKFGEDPNPKGPLELRVVEVTGSPGDWSISVLPDRLRREEKLEAGLPVSKPFNTSHLVSHRLQNAVNQGAKHVLVYVHGYNNDVEDVVQRAHAMANRFDVEVLAFSWPANGGGTGVADYLSDKRDAQISAGALDRTFSIIKGFLHKRWEAQAAEIRARATERHPHNAERRYELIARLVAQECPLKVNLLAHSMGCYVLKKMLQSSALTGIDGLFDNVVLVAADTNSKDHAQWLDRVECRGRILVAINENDYALRVSRMKPGQKQLARLGHLTTGLTSSKAVYVDFTDAPGVGNSHSYFEGTAVQESSSVGHRFFRAAFHGAPAEKIDGLTFDPRLNLFRA